jgi:hypothetical protein
MRVTRNGLWLGVILVIGTSVAFAQDTASNPKPKAHVRTITGCLAKGDGADEFQLTGTNGSTWEVRSDKVTLADHVGHTITATGVVSNAKLHNMKEDAKDAAADSGVKKTDTEHGHLTITSMKMVSESCR